MQRERAVRLVDHLTDLVRAEREAAEQPESIRAQDELCSAQDDLITLLEELLPNLRT